MDKRILIIDDDTSLRRVLEYNLQQEGYEIMAASDGEAGLRIFDESSPSIVITDLQMPNLSGIEVLQTVKRKSPETPVIVMTAFGTIETAVDAMKLGAYDFIIKPFNRDQMRLVVRKAFKLLGLSEENRQLRDEIAGRHEFRHIIGISKSMEKVFNTVNKVADTEATVLITGESGTGKEMVARSIHSLSSRRSGPFVAVNCAAIPRDLLESELFGHIKGAFTGAIKDKPGKFQSASGGTIFLDEVGELPIDLQPKILRVLQEREIEPVGGASPVKADVRVIAATNVDIDQAVSDNTFREDLYYRLAVITLHLPSLCERREDIPLLVKHFTVKYGGENVSYSGEAMDLLTGYNWPGNVRELENTIQRTLIMREGSVIGVGDLPERVCRVVTKHAGRVINLPEEGYPLEQLEKEVVLEALQRNDWNQTKAARFLRIPRHTLIYRMEKYDIQQPGK